ncbi:acyl-CoA synthetase [uncultured Maritimibacter sp.]|jgi:acyl-CoA synthetase (AMP-forming)/AMP-acid ligase II|uniref:acyl-CoA synthetase n=1 Tax=uncultured Maritimibacter sp. TaxID=991866 RepID=UPI000A4929DA|nr:acyl-CoA synthetase [uncultured Maritimibacter sp.]
MARYSFSSLDARNQIEAEKPWEARNLPVTIYDLLSSTTAKFASRKALSFQIESGPKDKVETLTWQEMHDKSVQAANLFRSLGIGKDDVVAYVLPNANETVLTLLGGAIAGIVAPINPLLEPTQIASILRETGAKVVVTLRGFPKTDVAQKVHEALKDAPAVKHVLEIDLNRYLTPPKAWIVPLIRPKVAIEHSAKVQNFNKAIASQPKTLTFEDEKVDRVAAYFHTGGTTGMPKVAQHKYSGIIYNGWLGANLLFDESDVLICPLPLFHVFAVHVVFMAVMTSGAHVVFPTPAGYRGEGVFDNFWKLIERYGVTFVITVPTAISALMQRKVDADVSTLKVAFSGSSPLPVELFNRFEKATDVKIVEGYGLTEATCLVSCNPTDGVKKIGSVGIPFPYTEVKIFDCDKDGTVLKEMGVDEVGEICVSNPGVFVGKTYTEDAKNKGLVAGDKYLRTGDLGRIDADGYLYITGRAKDIIIRGGHNIDPAEIEEALSGHDAVAFVGAIGQPDAVAGELPAAFVELVSGASVTEDELLDYAKAHISERAAVPKYIEIMPELPKTAVGKVFKPDLRKSSIKRVYEEALREAGHPVEVVEVYEDKKLGLVARLKATGAVDKAAVEHKLGEFTRPYEWVA